MAKKTAETGPVATEGVSDTSVPVYTFELVTTIAVGAYRVGDVVSDGTEIERLMRKHPHHFTKRAKSS